jgi:hypothetical protein
MPDRFTNYRTAPLKFAAPRPAEPVRAARTPPTLGHPVPYFRQNQIPRPLSAAIIDQYATASTGKQSCTLPTRPQIARDTVLPKR